MAKRPKARFHHGSKRIALSAVAALAFALGATSLTSVPALSAYESGQFSQSGNYLAGRFAGKHRDNAMAAEFYGQALRTDPNNAVILERTFLLELSSGNTDRAERLARRVIAQDSRNRTARIVLGIRDFKAGRHEDARQHWQAASHGPIGELTSALLTAWSFAAEKRTEEALSALKKLSRTESFGIYQTFHAALIADVGGFEQEARELYERAYASAGSSLRVVQAYGSFLSRNGDRDKARGIYETYAKSTNRHPLIGRMLDQDEAGTAPQPMVGDAREGAAEALFGLASALADESGIDFAIIYAQMTLDLKPVFPIALTLLADIYEDAKLHQLAIDVYERIPETSPLRENADIQIALDLNQLDKADAARDKLDKLIARDGTRYQPHMTLANILRGNSKFKEAAGAYTKAIGLIGDIEQRHWTVFYFRGICYERSKQWPLAEADFRKALELQPDQPLVLNYLGYSWVEQRHNLDEAFKMIRKAVELRPNDGYIVDSLGWAHYQLKQYEEAVEHLERAVELRPEDPVINDHLGDAYWRVGRKVEAKFQWRHAKDLGPEPENLEKIELKLENGLKDDNPSTVSNSPNKS
ncbi:MAG: tetratricopeptide repeat protein [Hyphomicrobiales bacterium]